MAMISMYFFDLENDTFVLGSDVTIKLLYFTSAMGPVDGKFCEVHTVINLQDKALVVLRITSRAHCFHIILYYGQLYTDINLIKIITRIYHCRGFDLFDCELLGTVASMIHLSWVFIGEGLTSY